MKKIIITLICITCFNVFAQKDNYPYFYKLQLGDQPSSCAIEGDTANHDQLNNSFNSYFESLNNGDTLMSKFPQINCETSMIVLDSDLDPIPFINVKIINSNGDTTRFLTDKDGMVKDQKNGCYFEFIINDPGYSPISDNVRIQEIFVNGKQRLILPKKTTVILGKSFSLTIPVIYSKRPLTSKELREIINDLSFGEKSKLVEDNTCRISFQL